MNMFSDKIKNLFDQVMCVVFGLILVFILFGIAIGTVQLFITTWKLFAFEGVTGQYIDLIADVLTLYVLIELSRSLVEYFSTHHLNMNSSRKCFTHIQHLYLYLVRYG